MIVMKNECATAEQQALTLELLQFLNRNVVGAGVFCWHRAIGAAYTFLLAGAYGRESRGVLMGSLAPPGAACSNYWIGP
jgi:hypothetical protein